MASRRRFIQAGMVSALGWHRLASLFFWLLAGCKSERKNGEHAENIEENPLGVILGPINAFPLGQTRLEMFRLLVVRDSEGYRAMSLVCTHQTCLLNETTPTGSGLGAASVRPGFVCPCHGSQFGVEGERLSGPAVKSLPWYLLSLNNRRELVVHHDSEVGKDWRLPSSL